MTEPAAWWLDEDGVDTCPCHCPPEWLAPLDAVVDFDRLEALAATFIEVIRERAAVWETQFSAGPGDAVGVSDAAWVIAKHLLTKECRDAT